MCQCLGSHRRAVQALSPFSSRWSRWARGAAMAERRCWDFAQQICANVFFVELVVVAAAALVTSGTVEMRLHGGCHAGAGQCTCRTSKCEDRATVGGLVSAKLLQATHVQTAATGQLRCVLSSLDACHNRKPRTAIIR